MSEKTENKTKWSVHAEWILLFITLVGGFYLLDGKIENLSAAQIARIDQVNTRIDQVNTRTDQLYEMFIDLLKEGRK